MNFKTLSAVAVGATLAALEAHAAEAIPKPADPFHWSTAIDASSVQTSRKIQYNRKTYVVPDNLATQSFIDD